MFYVAHAAKAVQVDRERPAALGAFLVMSGSHFRLIGTQPAFGLGLLIDGVILRPPSTVPSVQPTRAPRPLKSTSTVAFGSILRVLLRLSRSERHRDHNHTQTAECERRACVHGGEFLVAGERG